MTSHFLAPGCGEGPQRSSSSGCWDLLRDECRSSVHTAALLRRSPGGPQTSSAMQRAAPTIPKSDMVKDSGASVSARSAFEVGEPPLQGRKTTRQDNSCTVFAVSIRERRKSNETEFSGSEMSLSRDRAGRGRSRAEGLCAMMRAFRAVLSDG